jgi:hypothetical protein
MSPFTSISRHWRTTVSSGFARNLGAGETPGTRILEVGPYAGGHAWSNNAIVCADHGTGSSLRWTPTGGSGGGCRSGSATNQEQPDLAIVSHAPARNVSRP